MPLASVFVGVFFCAFRRWRVFSEGGGLLFLCAPRLRGAVGLLFFPTKKVTRASLA